MEAEKRNLRKEISEKLKDETLRGALGRFAEVYPEARAKAYENAGDIETLREAVRQMKIATVAQIEEVADRFEAEATKRGREGLPGEGRRRPQGLPGQPLQGKRGEADRQIQIDGLRGDPPEPPPRGRRDHRHRDGPGRVDRRPGRPEALPHGDARHPSEPLPGGRVLLEGAQGRRSRPTSP